MKNRDGSMTVEAAFVVPLAVMVCFCMLIFFRVLTFQTRLQSAIETTAEKLAMLEYVNNIFPGGYDTGSEDLELSELIMKYGISIVYSEISEKYARDCFFEILGENWQDLEFIHGGSRGIDFYISELSKEERIIDLRVQYTVDFPIIPGQAIQMDFAQRAVRRMWVGVDRYSKDDDLEEGYPEPESTTEEKKEEDEKVYITKNGTVYHMFRDCQALKRTVKTADLAKMADKRNSSGGKYYRCEYCVRGESNMIVYYTPDGDRYHNSQSCGSLVRYIIEISKKDVSDRELCKFCSKRKNETEASFGERAA